MWVCRPDFCTSHKHECWMVLVFYKPFLSQCSRTLGWSVQFCERGQGREYPSASLERWLTWLFIFSHQRTTNYQLNMPLLSGHAICIFEIEVPSDSLGSSSPLAKHSHSAIWNILFVWCGYRDSRSICDVSIICDCQLFTWSCQSLHIFVRMITSTDLPRLGNHRPWSNGQVRWERSRL